VDRIEVRGLRALGTHGVSTEEQQRSQPFEIDLDIEADLEMAAKSDDLADTFDYGEAVAVVARVVTGEQFSLLERLADAIAKAVLSYARVRTVTVSVRKLRPPLAADLASVGVTVTRRSAGADGIAADNS
ncbi:MAG: dihydroneopterin aldolase, partial [Acidimicrobiales bacterium]